MLCAMADKQDKQAAGAPYQVVARRFRPRTFAEVVGQDDVLQSLTTALQQGRIPHAFLFAGSRGVGKTTLARILARCLNCERGPTPTPCGKCAMCRAILDGTSTDIVEIDAASHNGVDDVRSMREHVGFAAMAARHRVFILDEAHMLSKPAWNAFLKTLEEPPPNVVFVLATTEVQKIPETIRSRCQVLLFRRVGEAEIVQRLRMIAKAEGVAVADDVLADIAVSSRGGMRDSETALERALSLARELGKDFDLVAWHRHTQRLGLERTIGVVAALLAGNAGEGLRFAAELQQSGHDEREALGEVVDVLRWMQLLAIDGDDSGLVPITGALRQRLVQLKAQSQSHQLDGMLQAGLLGRDRLKRLEDRGVVLELTFVRMAQTGALPTLADLLAEVRSGISPRAATPGLPPAAGGDLRATLLQRARQSRPMLAGTLELCRIDGPDEQGRVTIALQTDRKMHLDRLQAAGLQQEISGWLQAAAGRPLQVAFKIGAPAPAADQGPAASAPSAPPVAQPGPTTQRVVGRFGGRIVGRNPEDAVGRPEAEGPAGARDVPPDETEP
jgi:DNA polymerase-3 subunit gamma/tau